MALMVPNIAIVRGRRLGGASSVNYHVSSQPGRSVALVVSIIIITSVPGPGSKYFLIQRPNYGRGGSERK